MRHTCGHNSRARPDKSRRTIVCTAMVCGADVRGGVCEGFSSRPPVLRTARPIRHRPVVLSALPASVRFVRWSSPVVFPCCCLPFESSKRLERERACRTTLRAGQRVGGIRSRQRRVACRVNRPAWPASGRSQPGSRDQLAPPRVPTRSARFRSLRVRTHRCRVGTQNPFLSTNCDPAVRSLTRNSPSARQPLRTRNTQVRQRAVLARRALLPAMGKLFKSYLGGGVIYRCSAW